MFKKNDILPFILALVSTLAVLGLGYGALARINAANTSKNNDLVENNQANSFNDDPNLATSAASFSAPGIVPMGTSVNINGATQMSQINQVLKKSFQKEFPGTSVTVNADGIEAGMKLLLLGQLDLAALDRPLTDEEKARGLTAVTIEADLDSDSKTFFYAYRQPPNFKVEAFLGHTFSIQGQKAISESIDN